MGNVEGEEKAFRDRPKHLISDTEPQSPLQALSKRFLPHLKPSLDPSPFNLMLQRLEYEMIGSTRPISKFINGIKHLSSNHLCELNSSPFVIAIIAHQ